MIFYRNVSKMVIGKRNLNAVISNKKKQVFTKEKEANFLQAAYSFNLFINFKKQNE